MEKRPLSVLVALLGGNLSGVETYAEQIASAAATASHRVTLVAVGRDLADAAATHLGGGVRVIASDPMPLSRWRAAARQVPTLALIEMQALLDSRLRALGERFDVAHLNHPALAGTARRYADRVIVGAWFYPHRPRARFTDTWRHTGAQFPRSAGLAVKGLSHYWNDRLGYSACDCVVAPTEMFAEQLRSIGIPALACPPPCRPPALATDQTRELRRRSGQGRRVTICCGDLSHPRKNVRAGIRAVGILAAAGMPIDLELIGGNADSLGAEIRALPSSVDVDTPGRLSREQVEARLRNTDVLAMPSLYEEWGYVATEALLCGTPVVAFPVYPFVEMLASPLGSSARSMSPDDFALDIGRVLEAGSSRSTVRSAALRTFGPEAVEAKLSRIWAGGHAHTEVLIPALGAPPMRP